MAIRRVPPTLLACALLSVAFSAHAAPPEQGVVESPALRVGARFPKEPKLYRSEAYYGNGLCRAFHYALTTGKGKRVRQHDLMVLVHAKLRGTPEDILERLFRSDTRKEAKVLSKKLEKVAGHVTLRARFRKEANEWRGAQEIRAQYVVADGLVYKLTFTAPVSFRGSERSWKTFRESFQIMPKPLSHSWVPYLSGRGGFSALFPTRPSPSEDSVEIAGRTVKRVRVAASREGHSEFMAASYPLASTKGKQGRKERARVWKSIFASARQRALGGLASSETRSDEEVSPGCRELVVAGEIEGKKVLRVLRTSIGKTHVLTASATRYEAQPPLETLKAFVAQVRWVTRVDGSVLSRAAENAGIAGARLGTGEKLKGGSGRYAKGAIRTKEWTMKRAEFRLSDEEYLQKPALSTYSRLWTLRKEREVKLRLKTGAGVARTYFTRDGDDVLAIHERLIIDAEGYRCTSIVLRDCAVHPKHVEHLFADR
jgi:hypothetical protein